MESHVNEWLAANHAYLHGQITRHDFSEVVETIDQANFTTDLPLAVRDLRDLCITGATVMDLDADTFATTAGVDLLPPDVGRQLKACALPSGDVPQDGWRAYLTYGALADLRPLYSLMLELVDEYHDRHEVPFVLSLIHLISDHLGQLAWQSALPSLHPHSVAAAIWPKGKSKARRARLNDLPGDHWARQPKCAVADLWRTVLNSYSDESPKSLNEALRSTSTRVSTAIIGCTAPGGLKDPAKRCPNPCSVQSATYVATEAADYPPLGPRAALAAAFARSPIVLARHSSPVGHFFAVPSISELDKLWRQSLGGYVAGHRRALAQSAVLNAIAGAASGILQRANPPIGSE